jgi:hypothetical protein
MTKRGSGAAGEFVTQLPLAPNRVQARDIGIGGHKMEVNNVVGARSEPSDRIRVHRSASQVTGDT